MTRMAISRAMGRTGYVACMNGKNKKKEFGSDNLKERVGRCSDRWTNGMKVNLNPLTPNDPYRGRTAPLTFKVAFYIFIQQI